NEVHDPFRFAALRYALHAWPYKSFFIHPVTGSTFDSLDVFSPCGHRMVKVISKIEHFDCPFTLTAGWIVFRGLGCLGSRCGSGGRGLSRLIASTSDQGNQDKKKKWICHNEFNFGQKYPIRK